MQEKTQLSWFCFLRQIMTNNQIFFTGIFSVVFAKKFCSVFETILQTRIDKPFLLKVFLLRKNWEMFLSNINGTIVIVTIQKNKKTVISYSSRQNCQKSYCTNNKRVINVFCQIFLLRKLKNCSFQTWLQPSLPYKTTKNCRKSYLAILHNQLGQNESNPSIKTKSRGSKTNIMNIKWEKNGIKKF